MNTATTRTTADNSGTNRDKSSKKHERRKDVVYKGDRVDVWATGNSNVPQGTKKSMHPLLAEKLVAKGSYSLNEIEKAVESKKSKSRGKDKTAEE